MWGAWCSRNDKNFCPRSPQVQVAYMLKDVCANGVRSSRIKALKWKKKKVIRKERKNNGNYRGGGDEHRVRLLPPSTFYTLVVFCFSLSPSFFLKAFEGRYAHCSHTLTCYSHSLYLGASLTEAYLYGLHAQHMRPHFRMYLLLTIICIDMT